MTIKKRHSIFVSLLFLYFLVLNFVKKDIRKSFPWKITKKFKVRNFFFGYIQNFEPQSWVIFCILMCLDDYLYNSDPSDSDLDSETEETKKFGLQDHPLDALTKNFRAAHGDYDYEDYKGKMFYRKMAKNKDKSKAVYLGGEGKYAFYFWVHKQDDEERTPKLCTIRSLKPSLKLNAQEFKVILSDKPVEWYGSNGILYKRLKRDLVDCQMIPQVFIGNNPPANLPSMSYP